VTATRFGLKRKVHLFFVLATPTEKPWQQSVGNPVVEEEAARPPA